MNKEVLQCVMVFPLLALLYPKAAAAGGRSDVDVFIRLAGQPYYVGEPMRFDVVVTNRSAERGVFFYHHRGDRDKQMSGLIFSLTHVESGSNLTPRCGIDTKQSHFGKLCSDTLPGNLQRMFGELGAGRYALSVGIVDFLSEGMSIEGKHVEQISKTLDIQSAPVEFEVRGVDEAEAARVEGLLGSGARRGELEGIGRLEAARAGLFRREAPALARFAHSRDGRVRAAALRVLLARAELTERLSDDELYAALDAASRERDPALRLAAAKAVQMAGFDLARGRILRTFIDNRMGLWLADEESEACRAYLVAENALRLDVMRKVIGGDPSPQVRAAAVRRLSSFEPGELLKAADSFGRLTGEVEMDGKRQPLSAFVAEECAKAKARVGGADAK